MEKYMKFIEEGLKDAPVIMLIHGIQEINRKGIRYIYPNEN